MTSTTTSITCTCKVCTSNAKLLGKTTLGATVPAALAEKVGKAGVHNLVHLANDPNSFWNQARTRMNVTAA